jgi:hypothetical protein
MEIASLAAALDMDDRKLEFNLAEIPGIVSTSI